jgi:hypothetical protein
VQKACYFSFEPEGCSRYPESRCQKTMLINIGCLQELSREFLQSCAGAKTRQIPPFLESLALRNWHVLGNIYCASVNLIVWALRDVSRYGISTNLGFIFITKLLVFHPLSYIVDPGSKVTCVSNTMLFQACITRRRYHRARSQDIRLKNLLKEREIGNEERD